MKRKITAILISVPALLIALLILGYFLLAMYYKNGFSYNTWINGVYCTGKSIPEINDELRTRYETRSIEVYNPDGTVEYILPDEINYRIDFTDYLTSIKEKQNPYLWILNLFDWKAGTDITPNFSYDSDALNHIINGLSFVNNNKNSDKCYTKIIDSDNGFYLYDNYHKTVDPDAVYELVEKALYSEDPVVLTEDLLVFNDYSSKDLMTIKEWDFVSDYLTQKITLDMGAEKIPIDSSVLSKFIVLEDNGKFKRNDDGSLFVDEDKIRQYMDDICSMYDTYGKDRVYTTVKGEEKIITNVYYGTLLNHKAECDYLVNAIKNNISEEHIPTYIREGYVRGLDDIGPTYIEIDLGEQVLYYFEDGVVNLHCDIVSGLPGANLTPQMICSVYTKKKAAILRGTNYASYVDYWMAIYQGIGLHDASWQSAYGGDRYLTHGSHGCINMKKKDVSRLYDSVEIGIPVILYY